MSKPKFRIREFLNPEDILYSSYIDAYCGTNSFINDKGDIIEFDDQKLIISDCHNSVRIHKAPGRQQEYIDKIRRIGEVCMQFAVFLSEQEKLSIENINKPAILDSENCYT